MEQKVSIEIVDFIRRLSAHLNQGKLNVVVLSKPRAKNAEVSKVTIRPVLIHTKEMLQMTLQQGNQQIHQNVSVEEIEEKLTQMIARQFLQVNVQTQVEQGQIMVSLKGKITAIWKQQQLAAVSLQHDIDKNHLVSSDAQYLHLLGVTSAQGQILGDMKRKYLQINHFIQIFSSLLSDFPEDQPFHLTDMGCGKGYLTFAMYDFLKRRGYADVRMTGVDIKSKVMMHCNEVAVKCKFQGLHFEENTIDHYFTEKMDVLVALHACDTATDDALVLAIQKKARLVIVAPCCQKQVRRSLKRETGLTQSLYEFGMVKEKLATLFTDLIRVNVLKYNGYKVKMQEFIGLEHTAKNVMISGEFTGKVNHEALSEIKLWMDTFGIGQHYLLDRLNLF